MDALKQNLINLGLSEEEILVYLSALENGSATVLELARNTGIPRTTVYLLIDSLVEKQLLLLGGDEKKKQYVPAPPDDLIRLAQHKKERMQETLYSLRTDLPQLHALYRMSHSQPKVLYYQGKNEIIKLFTEALHQEKIYLYLLSQGVNEYFGSYLGTFRDELKRHMCHTKEILSESVENLEYQKEHNSIRNRIVLLPQKDVINIDSLIYGDKVVLLSYRGGKPSATVICDKEIQYFEVIKFNAVWSTCNVQDIQ